MLGSAKEQSMSDEPMVEVNSPTWRDMVVDERDELQFRRGRLWAFINGPHFSSVGLVDQGLLRIQYGAMGVYEDILTQRIERF
jgi:hypothetical protein